MFALSWGIAEPFVKMFTSDPETIEKALWGIRIYMIGIIPLSLQYAFVDGLTALEQPQFAITLSMTRKLVFMLGATILLPIFFGVQTAFYAEPIADVASAVLSTCVFLAVFPRLLKNVRRCCRNRTNSHNSRNNSKNDADVRMSIQSPCALQ